ncbi:MAG: YgiQ family radical SAM protein, partial [Fervidobacterium sp.]
MNFLPTTFDELKGANIKQLDIIFVTGDAYVDHPSFGVALLGRLLESKGYKVGIIAQPMNIED